MAAFYDVTRAPSLSNPLLSSLVGPTIYRSGYTVYFALAGRPGTNGIYNDGGAAWRSGGAADAFYGAVAAWNAVSNLVIKPWPFYYAEGGSRGGITWVEKITYDGQDSGLLGRHDTPGVVEQEGAFNAQSVIWSRENNAVGGLGFVTFLHEIGHGLGLEHPHEGEPFPGVVDPDDKGAFGLNQGMFTVMSYNDGYDRIGYSPSYSYGWMATPGALDIAAVQAVYGVNMNTRVGNDVYKLPSANGAGTYFSCIWDAGGSDTISGADLTVSCTIDLRPATLKVEEGGGGFLSRAPGIFGGFTIAAGVTIEGAIGGSAGDQLIGNDAANVLDGRGGADTLTGGGGDDRLTGGDGDDRLDGGTGFDVASYADATAGVTVRLDVGTAQATGGAGTDTLIGMEGLIGSAFADVLGGGDGIDLLDGGDGADRLSGGLGADRLVGGDGADAFQGTRAELAGDTVVDFARGDVIRITDADPAGFGFTQSGDIVDLGGGRRLTVTGLTGRLKAQAAAGGGVELVLTTADAVRGDINGDGRADVLWRHDNGALTNWLGRSDGGFAGNDAAAFNNVPTSLKVAGIADFNGDGRNDVLWRGADGALTNWLGRADGGFLGNDAAAFGNVPVSWKVAGTGDFNGDGRDDILWRHDNGATTDWLGHTDGGFTGNDAAAFNNVPTSLKVAGVGDFNGDGRDDILWRGADGALTNWLGRADGGFTGNDAAAFHNVPISLKVAGVGDFNGDGRDDILWRGADGALTNWLGRADGGFAGNDAAAFHNVPTSWTVAGVGDFNGDGRDDILWRHDNGALTDWLGRADGGFAGNDAAAFFQVPTNWHTQLQDFMV